MRFWSAKEDGPALLDNIRADYKLHRPGQVGTEALRVLPGRRRFNAVFKPSIGRKTERAAAASALLLLKKRNLLQRNFFKKSRR